MGKIVELDFNKILPTQDEIYERDIINFVRSYLRNPQDLLVPVIRTLEGDLLLDGHHSIVSLDLLRKIMDVKIYGWISENENDFIYELPMNFHQSPKIICDKNKNIKNRYDLVQRLNPNKSLNDLRMKYCFMQSPKKMMDYVLSSSTGELNIYND